MKTIGERVKWVREKRGLSCAALDEIADLSCGHTASIESKRRENPSATTVSKLARALGVTPQWIMFGGTRPQITKSA